MNAVEHLVAHAGDGIERSSCIGRDQRDLIAADLPHRGAIQRQQVAPAEHNPARGHATGRRDQAKDAQ